jgi:hypothetical protein
MYLENSKQKQLIGKFGYKNKFKNTIFGKFVLKNYKFNNRILFAIS